MPLSILVASAEPRLVDALKSNLPGDDRVTVVSTLAAAQTDLFQHVYSLVFVDHALMHGEPNETFVTIDSVVGQERGATVLLLRQPDPNAMQLVDQLDSFVEAVDLKQGRDAFDRKIRQLRSDLAARAVSNRDDPSISTDRLAREEIDLPAPADGSLVDVPLSRLLYTLFQRKESGVLELKYATHVLKFGIRDGELVVGGDWEPASELLTAFSWSHGHYDFSPDDVEGESRPMLPLIAEGCRDHARQGTITETMSPVMRRYPVLSNLWSERGEQLDDFPILQQVMLQVDGITNWETILSGLGAKVTDGFRAAYFAMQTDMVMVFQSSGLLGVAINYSREVRAAREKVGRAEVEKTKAYRATGDTAQRTKLEVELSLLRGKLRAQSPHEIFGVWEGCGKKVVRDRFYVLVKEHHPDVYGGNTTGEVKEIAQDIFILVKKAYQDLLGIEGEQTVPPPAGAGASNDTRSERKSTPAPKHEPNRQAPGRQRLDTPRYAGPSKSEPEDDSQEEVDVKEKLAMLSGFRKKQSARRRLRTYGGNSEASEESSAADSLVETSSAGANAASAAESTPEPEPEPVDERQAKLDKLLKRAQKVGHPDAPTPSKEFFGKGYGHYREGRKREAFAAFKRAYELDSSDPATMIFYAYTKFMLDPSLIEETEAMLRDALSKGNKQAAPDGFLFLGHVLKAKGEAEEAYKMFKRAHQLNPASRDAEREVRLAEKRGAGKKKASEPEDQGLFKGLFKK